MSTLLFAERQAVIRIALQSAIGTVKTAVFNATDPDSVKEDHGKITARWKAGMRAVEVSAQVSSGGAVSLLWTREEARNRYTCSDPDGSVHVRWMLFP